VEDLFDNKLLSDVVVTVGDKEWRAHKFVLAARSPVFADMFRFTSKESAGCRINIPEVNLQLFEQLLKFIYTSKVSALDRFAVELLKMADKVCISSQYLNCTVIVSIYT